MSEYRHVTVTFPDGRRVKSIVKEKEADRELLRLQMLYGVKVKFGRGASSNELSRYPGLWLEELAIRPNRSHPRPLSPAFGRGSGAPV